MNTTVKKICELNPQATKDLTEVIYSTTTLPPQVRKNDLTITCTQQAEPVYFYQNSS